MNPKLSILIPSTYDRTEMTFSLVMSIMKQVRLLELAEDDIQVLPLIDNYQATTGAKRNKLLEMATGDYVCHIDSDDEISDDYIGEVLKAIESNPDVIGFNGYMTTNGIDRCNFRISKDLPYSASRDINGTCFLRYNNHLSPIKKEIALAIKFPEVSFGEDYDYATRLKESGLIKTEVYIEKDLYHYKFSTIRK